MHKITDEQVDFILDDIKANGVNTEDLQYNLLDHICCIIEHEMTDRDDFYEFYERILPRFFKKELKEIQEETDNLLTFKHYYAMKKTLKISGIVSSILMLLGATFKVMHWPGAGVMIVLGGATFSLVFLPLMIALKFRDEEKTTDKLIFGFSFILGIMGIMGALFKVMHWPYANFLMISSASLFIFVYIPTYFISRFRRAEEQFNTIINSVLMLGFGCMIFALINVSGSNNVVESVNSSYLYMVNNTEKIQEENGIMLRNMENEKSITFHNASEELNTQLEKTKGFLISVVNQIPMENAHKLNMLELKNPNAPIKNHFEDGKGEYSLSTLKSKVNAYNAVVKTFYPNNQGKQIAFDDLKFDNTILSVVLYELTQMQWQVANNENNFLTSLSTHNETSLVMTTYTTSK